MRLLRDSAQWTFYAALAVAPWYYGGTTAVSINVINWLIGTTLIFWIADLVVNRRSPRLPKLLVILTGLLLLIGAWMVLNAAAILDSEFDAFAPTLHAPALLRGSVDYAISSAWLTRGFLLLGTILFISDLALSDRRFLHLAYVIGAVSGSICLLGLLQKSTGARMIFWQPALVRIEDTNPFFASYFYHGNAGAFLNLILPVSTGLAMRSFSPGSGPTSRTLWLTIFALNLAAIAANTSRGAQFVAVVMVCVMSVHLAPTLFQQMSRARLGVSLAGALAVFLLLFAIAQASHLELSEKRWRELSEQGYNNGRIQVAKVAVGILPHVGPLGFGPGTFRVVFPYFNAQSDNRVLGFWRFLHEDYLQTVIEWGWVGAAAWGGLFFGGIVVAVRSLRRQRQLRAASSEHRVANQAQRAKREELSDSAKNEGKLEDRGQRTKDNHSHLPIWSPRRRLLLPLIIIALGGLAIHAIADFPFQIYSIQLYVATYLGMCWGSATWNRNEKVEVTK